MENSVDAAVRKSGEVCIQTSLTRCMDGLLVNVWAQPRVEDFVRSLGTGEHIDIQTLGRHWFPTGKTLDKKMLIYEFSKDIGPLSFDGKFSFRLDLPGSPLVALPGSPLVALPGYPLVALHDGREGEIMLKGYLNLSFIRLVGISEGTGVSFIMKSVSSRESMIRLAEHIEQATSRFYREFIKPYKCIVTVSTMPIQEGD